MSHHILNIGSDNLVTLSDLTDNFDGTVCNDATASGTLTRATDSTALADFDYTYESGSDGKYEAIIPASVTGDLTEDSLYKITTTVEKDGSTLYLELFAVAKVKEFH